MEAHLLELDAQIKSNLGLERANADKCLEAMNELLSLSINPLMLKKHPHIVETVKRVNICKLIVTRCFDISRVLFRSLQLRRYVGNLTVWKLSKEDEVNIAVITCC